LKQIHLNRTDLNVSNVVMGTDSLGSLVDDVLSYKLLDCYTEQEGNLLDTAECYAYWTEAGRRSSERLIGQWLKDRKNRHDMVISTKGGFYLYQTPSRLSEREIFEDLEGSLISLGTDYIDIYWLHRDDETVPVEGIMDTLAKAVKQGKVRYIGVSNWSCKRIEKANHYAKQMGYPTLIASQIQFSPAHPNVEKNEPDLVLMNEREYDYFKTHDMAVFAFAAQAKGFFSKYDKGGEEALSPKAKLRYLNEETLKRYERLKRLSKEHECSIGSMVIATLISNTDFLTLPIIGCKTEEQLKDSLCGANVILSQSELNYVYCGE